mgnify:CR=1 FL=1|tara:strand:+ start:226 stop:609 length:384 start_codon:yes stop_codon:yes gene_type:complete
MSEAEKIRVLVADDEELMCDLICDMLGPDKYEVTMVNDGQVAVDTYKEGEFDVFITDIIMPEKEGLATIREVRMHDPDAKIIAISGGGLINLYDLLKAASLMGAQKILPKPFTAEELEFAIAELLKE